MDNELISLNQINQKDFVQISGFKAKIQSIQTNIFKKKLSIRKLNEFIRNLKEDLKFSCQYLNQPKQLIDIIRKIYRKSILSIHVN